EFAVTTIAAICALFSDGAGASVGAASTSAAGAESVAACSLPALAHAPATSTMSAALLHPCAMTTSCVPVRPSWTTRPASSYARHSRYVKIFIEKLEMVTERHYFGEAPHHTDVCADPGKGQVCMAEQDWRKRL